MNSILKSLFTGLIFAGLLFTVSCNHPDNEINATCFDEEQNQEEAKVDCGGPNCPPCPPTCNDGILNQGEQYVDCGGPNCDPCGTCDDGFQNAVWVPALNAFVMEQGIDCGFPCPNYCAPTCEDGIQNGNEEGIDCGGSCPDDCPPPSCFDGVRNGDETGVDCGGMNCPPCPVPTCNDGIQNQDETGIDCGGICQTECPQGTCTDGIMNNGESGIDCGPGCPTVCPPESCNDGVLNNEEEWVDCGGPNCDTVCPTCDDEVQNGPESGVDCVTTAYPDYSGGTCPPCETCYDDIQNQDESGVDCGGLFCEECEMWLNAVSLNGSPFVGVNFSVQEGFGDITFSATQTINGFTRSLSIKVPLDDAIGEGDSEDIQAYGFGGVPSVQFTNPNGVVFESLEDIGQMTITIKTVPASLGPKRIEGVIDMTEMEDVDFSSTATTTAQTIEFGINF